MSDIFEQEIDDDDADLAALEDSDDSSRDDDAEYVFPHPLYKLRLEYSSEGIYATAPAGTTLAAGGRVIVPTRYGLDIALVLGQSDRPVGIRPDDVVRIERVADERDLRRFEELSAKEADAFAVFREKVERHRLNMKLVSVHFLAGEQKALFFFSSESRVDFRELVKDLVSVFKMRIELRQIGVRDESRITGGLGVCGRPYCCHSVSDKLRPVSIRMAKDQNLSLNSTKISGQCGRLLCCLSYEFDWYAEERKKLPNEGIRLHYDGTNFKVTEVNPLASMVRMLGEDGRLLEVNASRFVRDGTRWRIE